MIPIRRSLRVGLVLLALCGMLPVIQADGSWWLLGVAVATAVASELIHRWGGSRSVHAFVQVAALLSLVFLWIEVYAVAEPVPPIVALSHFLVLLCCCKFFELRTARDCGVVLTIALLLLVVGGLVSAHVVFAVVLVLSMTFGTLWGIAFHQAREVGAIAIRAASSGASTALVADAGSISTPCHARRLAPAVIPIGVLLTLTAVVAFVLTPRGLGQRVFGRFRTPFAGAITGYTDRVELTTNGVQQSDVPVARVRLTRDGEPYGYDGFPLYLRGRTLRCYAQRRWLGPADQHVWHIDASSFDEPRTLSAAAARLGPSQLLHQEIWLERGAGPYLFSLYPPLSVAAGESFPIEQDCDDLSLKVARYSGGPLHYILLSPVPGAADSIGALLDREYADRVANQSRTRRVRDREINRMFDLLPGPSIDRSRIPDRIAELAANVVAPIGDPDDASLHARMADKIREYFRAGQFEHTLGRVDSAAGVDKIEHFLFESRRGHCEFFASAMTLMCQSLRIPARVVTGYYGGEYNPVGSFFVIRRKDAHAWVEVLLKDRGWVLYDPTPSAGNEAAMASSDLGAVLDRIGQYLQFEWVTFVVSFDPEHRRQLFGRFEGWFRQIDESRGGVERAFEIALAFLRGPPELGTSQRVLYWIMLGLVLLMVLLVARVAWILWIMLRERFPRRSPGRFVLRRTPDTRYFDRLLMLLARRGFPKPPQMTPREFAADVAARDPTLAAVVDLTAWYYEAQYGRRSLSPQRSREIRDFLGYLREGLPLTARFRGR